MGLDIIKTPKDDLRSDILEAIVQPENIGDLHIKMMLQEPLEYGVNRTLVGFMIQSFFELLWDHPELKLNLDILQGEHREIAFVEIKTSMDCLKVNRAPQLTPY